MKFSGKSCENFKKLGILEKAGKILRKLCGILEKISIWSDSFIENTAFLY